jgi:hypothetical protein
MCWYVSPTVWYYVLSLKMFDDEPKHSGELKQLLYETFV